MSGSARTGLAPLTTVARRFLPVVLAVVVAAGCDDGAAGAAGPALDLPPRPAGAPGGREIADEIAGLDLEAREERIYAEIARGNVPGWLRPLERVEVTADSGAAGSPATFWVARDYLAVGSDEDFFYTPLSPGTARRVARLVGGSLPTPGLVDAVWAAADTRLVPIRIRPDEHMGSIRYFERHSRLVQAQRQPGSPPGDFVAGHKVDVVRIPDPRTDTTTAIYGWHRSSGEPIQPLYPVPLDYRPHFSMGVRLVVEPTDSTRAR